MIATYDGTYAGFLSAVFELYRLGASANGQIINRIRDCRSFLDEVVDVDTDDRRAARVATRLVRMGWAQIVYRAWLSQEPEIENNLFAVLRAGLNGENGGRVLQQLHLSSVKAVTDAARRVGNEIHRSLQFTRFVEIVARSPGESALYVADIEPRFDILEQIAPYFARRMNTQRLMIRDKLRGKMMVYDCRQIRYKEDPLLIRATLPADRAFEVLWRWYYQAVEPPPRHNPKLRENLVSLHSRQYTPEFLMTESNRIK